MTFNSIERLRAVDAISRPTILNEVYQKNLAFFKARHPALLRFIETVRCHYHIDITDNFLNIVDERSGQLAHPEAGLDRFAELLGGWTHEAWIDLFNFQIPMLDQYPKHHNIVSSFSTRLHQAFPETTQRLASGRINLKELAGGRKFSPPVVFLGIFHGLHIAQYLKHTDLTTALFIEPEPERFEVSCYFLDYAEIEQRLGKLYLAIGGETTSSPMESFFSLLRITPQMWIRVLCGYSFAKAPFFIESIKSLQATSTNLLYPLDNELDGLMHGALSLNRMLPLLSARPRVSKQCRIAVVATGPSLNNDLDWLKRNQQNLIIIAAHSAVKVLRAHGIKPDFQCNIDSVINYNFMQSLQLFPDVPLLTYYKAPPHILADFATPLLCADAFKNPLVQFNASLTETHPSTTNLAFSFACYCRPERIYLIGCDCGFRQLGQDHARGSVYENLNNNEPSKNYARNSLQSLVEPNFAETEPIQTISQYLRTKIVLENCLAANAKGISVVNLSDGALIIGATPQHSAGVRLPKGQTKQKDIKTILTAFSPARERKNWKPYPVSGANRLQSLKDGLTEALTLKKFSWSGFCLALDTAMEATMICTMEECYDYRIHIYHRVIADLLYFWYRCLIFLDDEQQAQEVYATGLQYLKETLRHLEWPISLDLVHHAGMEENLTPKWKMYLAQLHGKEGNFHRAETLLTRAYRENAAFKDGFAQLGWIYAEKGDWDAAWQLARHDAEAERLSPPWKVDIAQLYGRRGYFDQAIALVAQAYEENPALKDGFAKLGWIYTEKRNWDAACEIAQRDLTAGRASPGWKVNIAQLFGRRGNFAKAEALIAQTYMENAALKNGYARLGWIKMETREWSSAHTIMMKDQLQGRLSPGWKIQLAIAKGCLHYWPEAMTLVDEAYMEDATLRNGYSQLGWWGYLLGKGKEFFRNQIDKDKKRIPTSIDRLLFHALYASMGNARHTVLDLVEQAYQEQNGVRNWYTVIGWLHIRLGNTSYGLELMEIDQAQKRMDEIWLPSYAITLGFCGKKEQALNVLQAVARQPEEEVVHNIGYLVFPDARMSMAQLQAFVSSGLHFEELKKCNNLQIN